jgi:hypothetical protein
MVTFADLIAESFELVADFDIVISGLFLYNFELVHNVIAHVPQVNLLKILRLFVFR